MQEILSESGIQLLNQFSSSIESLKMEIHHLKKMEESKAQDVQTLTSEIETLKTTVVDLKQVSAVLQNLVDKISEKSLRRVEELLNLALSSIFTDQDLSVKIETSIKRNLNCYEVVLYNSGRRQTDICNSSGGGVVCCIAFILKILCALFTKRQRLLIFDESLSQLSKEYLPQASKFIKDLCKELGLTLILVTHQETLSTEADFTLNATYSESTNSVEYRLIEGSQDA